MGGWVWHNIAGDRHELPRRTQAALGRPHRGGQRRHQRGGARLQEIQALCKGNGWPEDEGLYTWDIADQFTCLKPARVRFDDKREATPDTILRMLRDYKAGRPSSSRTSIRYGKPSAAPARLAQPGRQPAGTLAAQEHPHHHPGALPAAELKHDVPILELAKPDSREMDALLERTVVPPGPCAGEPGPARQAGRSRLGLTSTQAGRVFQKAVVSSRAGQLDERCIDLIIEEKRAIIRESGALELYPYVEQEDRVGGLEALKAWLAQRRLAFCEEARDYGLDLPRGVALIGIPGTGKSLCAKVTAGMWKLPLLRLDMGAVFGGILGSSEKNIREAMQIAEVIAPCVLWVDEIEKAFAGSAGDSGTASRVLGTFLTWMQEKQHAGVRVRHRQRHRAPAAGVPAQGPLRRGVLPRPAHGRGARADPGGASGAQGPDHDPQPLRSAGEVARATEGFVGAELEAVVKDAMFPAFMDGQRETRDRATWCEPPATWCRWPSPTASASSGCASWW